MITFEPFWETLKTKGISQYDLIQNYNFSTGTLDNIRKNKSITLNTLDNICTMLNCDINDVIKFTNNNNKI
ncbi:MAG: helix-turn-helix domain-containing protein [Lachnospirales bacterium]